MKPVSVLDYYILAKKKLKPEVFSYISGAAGEELTSSENTLAFEKLVVKPFVLRDVSVVKTDSLLLKQKCSFPLMIAPTAFHQLVHQGGEIGTAKVAQHCNIPMVVSVMSNDSIEAITSDSNHDKLWFQVYLFKDRAITQSLVQRAESLGFKAIMLTVGAPCSGRRYQELRMDFQFPSTLKAGNLNRSGQAFSVSDFMKDELDASVTWDDIDWLISLTKLPVYLKGILNSEDAERACQVNVAGIVVSNHGGRQLDTAIASLYALPEITEVVNNRVDILFDGGIRNGTDILKAYALGANAVMIGRPVLWALASGGAKHLTQMISDLREEFEIAMKLTGCSTVQDIRKLRLHTDLVWLS